MRKDYVTTFYGRSVRRQGTSKDAILIVVVFLLLVFGPILINSL